MNQVLLSGRMTRDPDIRATKSGMKTYSFTLAVYRTKELTDFIRCTAFDKTAERMEGLNLIKGAKLVVTGSLKQSKYQDKDGNNRERVEVYVNAFEAMIGGTPEITEVKPEDLAPEDDDLPF